MTRDDVQSRIALVHRLQRERGATCAWSPGAAPSPTGVCDCRCSADLGVCG